MNMRNPQYKILILTWHIVDNIHLGQYWTNVENWHKQTKTKTYTKFEKNIFKFVRCVRTLPVRPLRFEINAVFAASQLHMAWVGQENK